MSLWDIDPLCKMFQVVIIRFKFLFWFLYVVVAWVPPLFEDSVKYLPVVYKQDVSDKDSCLCCWQVIEKVVSPTWSALEASKLLCKRSANGNVSEELSVLLQQRWVAQPSWGEPYNSVPKRLPADEPNAVSLQDDALARRFHVRNLHLRFHCPTENLLP